ncbi:MAG: ribosomal protein S18-alanine N-acetyltransferase [Gammaproteobacteria bacterium]
MANDALSSQKLIKVSLATFDDFSRIHAIDIETNISPWTLDQIKSSFQAGHIALKATFEAELIGFLIYEPIFPEAHLLSIAVESKHQSNGIGKLLLKTLLQQAKAQDIKIVYLEVRQSNYKAIKLYESLGFIKDAIRVAYYSKPQPEDALLMSIAL